jgi:hypothetical protein
MDRRRFAKLIAAAVVGVRAADEVLPAGPTLLGQPVTEAASPTRFARLVPITTEQLGDAGGYFVHEDFADELLWMAERERVLLYGTGRGAPRGLLTSRGRHA